MYFPGSCDLAVDIGTSAIRVSDGSGAMAVSPAWAGSQAALRRGVIVNPRAATAVLRPLLRRRGAGGGSLRVLACAPGDVSDPERQLVRSCLLEAGASDVMVVPEPLAAAVGSGIDIGCRYAKFLADFGEGVTDCAVFRDGGIIASRSVRTGCADLRAAIRHHIRQASGLAAENFQCDRLLLRAGLRREGTETVRASRAGRSHEITLSLAALHAALQPVITRMFSPLLELLRTLPAATGAEVIEDGLFLSGGGSLLPGLPEAVARLTGITVRPVESPLDAVVRGGRRMLPFADSLGLWNTPVRS